MPTKLQREKFYSELKSYRSKYLKKKYADLDESATRLMVNHFFTAVLGYVELEDIKTEYRIRGEYADYVIQLNRKKRMVVEVKAIQLDLDEKHLRQSMNYAANEGIDWIMLINGKALELYRVIFGKPVQAKKLLAVDFSDLKQIKTNLEYLYLLTKRSMAKDEIEEFWTKFNALEPEKLAKYLYSEDQVRLLKRLLKKDAGLNFSEEDIMDSLSKLINKKLAVPRPKNPYAFKKK